MPADIDTTPVFYIGADFDTDCRPFLDRLIWADFIGRYSKNLNGSEYAEAKAAGLAVLLIFEVGVSNPLGGKDQGVKDAELFLRQMDHLSIKPLAKSAVFVACDRDITQAELSAPGAYYQSFSDTVLPQGWQIGGYACGLLQYKLLAQFHDRLYYPWSAGAKGWTDTAEFDKSGKWVVNQGPEIAASRVGSWPHPEQLLFGQDSIPPQSWPALPVAYDPNIAVSLEWTI